MRGFTLAVVLSSMVLQISRGYRSTSVITTQHSLAFSSSLSAPFQPITERLSSLILRFSGEVFQDSTDLSNGERGEDRVGTDEEEKRKFKRGQEITVTILQFGPLGASAEITGGEGRGLILQSELAYFR